MKALLRPASALRRLAWFRLQASSFVDSQAGRKPRLLVDLSVIARHDAGTGIQRVVRAIWNELIERQPESFDVIPVYAGANHGYCYLDLTQVERCRRFTGQVVGVTADDKFLGLDLSAHYLHQCAEQLQAWRRTGATVYLVVYDLLPLVRPEYFTRTTHRHFFKWFETVGAVADRILCISETVLRDVRARLTATSVHTFGRLHLSGRIDESVPSIGITPATAVALGSIRAEQAILMVGTVEPRKGHDAALAAFERLHQRGESLAPHLLLVGRPGWKTEQLQSQVRNHPLLGSSLHWLTDATDETLTFLYQRCLATLVASRGEGFGLPLAEAASHRKWSLTRDLTVFREQNLPNCIYFNDDAPDALADSMLEVAALARNSHPPAPNMPTWKECVDCLLDTLGLRVDKYSGQACGPEHLAAASPWAS